MLVSVCLRQVEWIENDIRNRRIEDSAIMADLHADSTDNSRAIVDTVRERHLQQPQPHQHVQRITNIMPPLMMPPPSPHDIKREPNPDATIMPSTAVRK
jgi:hypothetical protein